MRPTTDDVKYYFGVHGSVERTLSALRASGFAFRDSEVRKVIRALQQGCEYVSPQTPLLFISMAGGLAHEGFIRNAVALMQELGGLIVTDRPDSLIPNKMGVIARAEVRNDFLSVHGELRLHPNLVNPLTGMASYSEADNVVLFHNKQRMESIATMPGSRARLLWSTGSGCTPETSYDGSRAALRARKLHTLGGLLYLPGEDGASMYPIQSTESDGSFYFMQYHCCGGSVQEVEDSVHSVNFGDIHTEKLDDEHIESIVQTLDALQPQRVLLHDLLDFEARNHHETFQKFLRFRKFVLNSDEVGMNILRVARLLSMLAKRFPDTEFIVVPSNHNDALDKWVNSPQPDTDYKNIAFWHACNSAMYTELYRNPQADRSMLQILLHEIVEEYSNIVFPSRNDSIQFKGVEFNLHGDAGPNGVRGTARNIDRLGMKANIGHVHSPCILNFVYAAGVHGKLDHGYNKGLSSWANSAILTYKDGSRTMSVYGKFPKRG